MHSEKIIKYIIIPLKFACGRNFVSIGTINQTNECMATGHSCEHRVLMDYRDKSREKQHILNIRK